MAYIGSISQTQENVPGIMSRYPEQNVALYKFTEQVMRSGECSFSSKDRELIAAFTSGTNNCKFCYNTHARTAAQFGLDEGFIEGLVNDIDSSPVDEKMKPVLKFVKKLTETSYKIVQSDVDAILDVGWTENDFHFTVMICALFNFYNRVMDGYGCVSTDESRDNASKLLANHGYDLSTWPTDLSTL